MGRGYCQKKQDDRLLNYLAMIDAGLRKKGIDKRRLADKTGINYSTLCLRARNSETIKGLRLGELLAIIDCLQPDEHTKEGLL